MNSLPPYTPLVMLAALALLPVLGSWLAVLVPSRRREISGVALGNPLESAALAPVVPSITKPLVHLSRSMSGSDMEGYILGLRHLPVEHAAPLLARFVKGNDPALQLYAQSILQHGREELAAKFHLLQKQPPGDPRSATWLLETGLRLAHPSLCSATERPGFLKHLGSLAAQRLHSAEPTPALLITAAQVFFEAGMLDEAAASLAVLPPSCLPGRHLTAGIAHARHQKTLA